VLLSSIVELKAALPVAPGAAALKVIWIFVPVIATLVPSVTVITCPATTAQYWPAPGTGQFGVWAKPPTDTAVTPKAPYPAGAVTATRSTPVLPTMMVGSTS
jgi:hypothetical protein